ncbi:formate dehydrogenase subunit alpha [Thermofilum pendens]|uniref:Formate dehydrogenase alpha subunit n=1 Tax=Thermofilum pendens (strain DSM 2475 / Hrk 5) TaxID=368408 RepID=A1S025_THEPD|nr:formate dehydrogenase subunit alpha [Thermofilum pendens]ABL78805.1 formate dehydrogenase alpha subunit [Thermofilum pendens Hrk 5]
MPGEIDRRSFLKLAAIAASALALPVEAQPIPLKPWKTQWGFGEIGGKGDLAKARITPVICPYCSMGCSIDFYTFGDQILWTEGSPDSYINFGALCPKGKAAFELVENEMRVTQPMIRTGPKPPPEEILSAKSWDELVALVKKYPPQWKPVSWDEAFRFIASRVAKILNEWRSSSGAPKQPDGYYYVGSKVPIQLIGSSIMVNEAGYLTTKLAEFLGTTNVDSQYRKCHSSTVSSLALTYGWGAETATIEDVALADVVLFFSSPAEAHPLSFQYFLKGKKERGTIFITFDPRYSRTAMASDLWVPFRSGTDTAIFLYILHYAFFERDPPIDSLDAFKALRSRWNVTDDDLADFKELIKEYDAETVSRITGVPVDMLRTVARIYVENSGVATNHKKHGVVQWAMGMTQHTNATINIIRAAAIMQLLLGNVGFPGGGAHPFRGHSNVQGVTDVQGGGLGALPGYHASPSSTFYVRLYQDWKLQGMPDAWNWVVPEWARKTFTTTTPDKGSADLTKILQVYTFYGWRRFELLWGFFCGTVPEDDPVNGTVVCDFPFGTGSTEITFPRRVLNGEIRAAFIFGENPAVTNPNAKVIWAALSKLDLLVVSDIFETETAWFADVLLPASSFAEVEGTKTNGNRVIQWTYAALNPRGESRPDYWIITKLFQYLRNYGAVKLPSEVFGLKSEKVKVRKGGRVVLLYERPLRPDASWDYSGGKGAASPIRSIEAEVNPRIINKEINFAVLIYQGMYDPVRDEFTSMRRDKRLRQPGEIDGLFSSTFKVYKNWGWSWPMNVRILYSYTGLADTLGTTDTVYAAGRQWQATGETGEWIDEYTGEYRPAFIPGHNFWLPRAFKRRLSGVADLYGGIDVMHLIRHNELRPLGLFAVEDGGEVKLLTFEEYVASTGMKYLWANDTLYWDQDTAIAVKATVKRAFFPGGGWRQFKPTYEQMRATLKKYYEQTGNMRDAVNKTIQELKGWYPGYSFTWPIHTEPVESPDLEMAIRYPTLAWLNSYNLQVLNEQPDIVRGKPVGVALTPQDLSSIPGELVVITTNRLTEHWHSGSMTRRTPLLAELDPEPFVYVPRELARKLGVNSGDYVEIITARGSIKMRAYVTEGEAYLTVNGRQLPHVNVVWAFSFLGYVTGPQGNFISPDVGDVVTTIQETKAWIGKIRKAEVV